MSGGIDIWKMMSQRKNALADRKYSEQQEAKKQLKLADLIGQQGHDAYTPSAGFTPGGVSVSKPASQVMEGFTPDQSNPMSQVPTAEPQGMMTPLYQDDVAATGLQSPSDYARSMQQIAAVDPSISNAMISSASQMQAGANAEATVAKPISMWTDVETTYLPNGQIGAVGIDKRDGVFKPVPQHEMAGLMTSDTLGSWEKNAAGQLVYKPTVPQQGGQQPQQATRAPKSPYHFKQLSSNPTKGEAERLGTAKQKSVEELATVKAGASKMGETAQKLDAIHKFYGDLPPGFLGKIEMGLGGIMEAAGLLSEEEQITLAQYNTARAEEMKLMPKFKSDEEGNNQYQGSMQQAEWKMLLQSIGGLEATETGRKLIARLSAIAADNASNYRDMAIEYSSDPRNDMAKFDEYYRSMVKDVPNAYTQLSSEIDAYKQSIKGGQTKKVKDMSGNVVPLQPNVSSQEAQSALERINAGYR